MFQKLIVNIADGILGGLVLAGCIVALWLVWRYAYAVLTCACSAVTVGAMVSVVSLVWHRAWEIRSR
jgi:hypothetical protein